jgi:hypothetical protein
MPYVTPRTAQAKQKKRGYGEPRSLGDTRKPLLRDLRRMFVRVEGRWRRMNW